MAEIRDLSITDASNTARFPEAQAPSTVNNGARALEGMLARAFEDTIDGILISAGTGTAYTLAPNRSWTASHTMDNGTEFFVRWHAACVNSPTLNVDTTDARQIRWPDGTTLSASDIIAESQARVKYNSSLSCWIMMDAPVPAKNALPDAFQNVVQQQFTATGTYTPTTGMVYCIIEVIGGGGGGGGGSGATAGGSGGGAGAYSRSRKTAANIGASQAVTIGAGGAGGASTANGSAGGASSVGVLVTANGGSGGSAGNGTNGASGGVGGTAGTGDVASPGGDGDSGSKVADVAAGSGGASFMGGGGAGGTNAIGPNAAAAFGAGGGGSQGGGTGGAGKAGIVIITDFVSP